LGDWGRGIKRGGSGEDGTRRRFGRNAFIIALVFEVLFGHIIQDESASS
jgi:hypothetical protein